MRDGSDNGQALVTTTQAGAMVRQDFGGQEIQRAPETASMAVAATARAQVEARYLMSERHPRDWDVVREKWLKECSRPTLAEVGIWRLPRGGKTLEGPSIRLAEVALRCMTNVFPESKTIFDDAEKRILLISVTDLEANLTYSREVVVEKTMERKTLRQGQTPISQRINSVGEVTYRVERTPDDLLAACGAAESKALRVLALRLFPGDILDEGMQRIREVLRAGVRADPDAAKKKLLAAFGEMGVKADQLKMYVGHDLDGLSPAEHEELRATYAVLRDGEATWADILEAKTGVTTADKPPADTAALAAQLEKKKAERAAAKTRPLEAKVETAPTAEKTREPGADG